MTETFNNVWDAIADTPEQGANLRARADLMRQIADIIKAGGWTQADAASRCGVTQPRMNDLLRGRVSRFSLDALVNMATALGRRVHVEIRGCVRSRRAKVVAGTFWRSKKCSSCKVANQ